MRLYADYSLLNSDMGTSAAAYRLLRQAGFVPELRYISANGPDRELVRLVGEAGPPLLVTDDGAVFAGLSSILGWLGAAA